MLSKPGSRLAGAIKVYLDCVWWLCLVLVVVLIVVAPWFLSGLPGADPAPGLNLLARFSLQGEGGAVAGEQEGLQLRGQGELWIPSRSRTAWSLYFGVGTLVLAAVLYATWQLRSLVRTVRGGRPFAPENAGRIRRVGMVVVGWSLMAPVAKYLVARVILRELSVPGVALKPPVDIQLDVLFLGLAILVLAEVFHHAALLQQDQSLTI